MVFSNQKLTRLSLVGGVMHHTDYYMNCPRCGPMTQQLDHLRRPEMQAQFSFPPKATPRNLCDHGQWDMLWSRVIRICDQYRLATPVISSPQSRLCK